MSDITKIKIDNERERSYKDFPANREFKKRAEDDNPGGGWPSDLPKPSADGYGWVEENEGVTIVDGIFHNEEFLTNEYTLIKGQAYDVTFNGVEYNNLIAFDDYDITIGGTYGQYDEYPFCIYNEGNGIYLCTDFDGDCTILITTGRSETVHKIDEKYIPESGGWPADLPKPSVGGYGYSEEGIIIVSALQNVAFDQRDGELWMGQFDSPFEIVPGETYEVEYDDTSYRIDAEAYYGGMTILGDFGEGDPDFNRYPFIIVSMGEGSFVYGPDNGTHAIQIRKNGILHHKIFQEYLPIATREEYGVVRRDELPVINHFVGESARWDQLIAAAGSDIFVWHNVPIIDARSHMGSEIFFRRADMPATLLHLNAPAHWTDYVDLRSADVAKDDIITCGLYLNSHENTNINYHISVGEDGDQDYIDFNHDFRIVGGRELHITSSTPGSNKKFKITVDDSGTLSVTKITV